LFFFFYTRHASLCFIRLTISSTLHYSLKYLPTRSLHLYLYVVYDFAMLLWYEFWFLWKQFLKSEHSIGIQNLATNYQMIPYSWKMFSVHGLLFIGSSGYSPSGIKLPSVLILAWTSWPATFKENSRSRACCLDYFLQQRM
jgi:hypothetical protein